MTSADMHKQLKLDRARARRKYLGQRVDWWIAKGQPLQTALHLAKIDWLQHTKVKKSQPKNPIQVTTEQLNSAQASSDIDLAIRRGKA